MTFASRVAVLAIAIVAVPGIGRAQNTAAPKAGEDSVTVRASRRYGASGVHEFLLGENYRAFWYQPIRVAVLSLAKYGGGLTALEEGGNAQTRNLHLRGGDGKEYVFRPVFKDVLELPDALKHTVIEDIFADGLSASHPAATVLPNAFLRAAGLLHPEPELFVMPDDPKLGEFRKHFAGRLGTIEEFPEDPKDRPGFGGAVDIIDSEDLLEKINAGASDRIDAHALLTARMIDLLIGDNDRHPGQWKWARMQEGKNALWVPIARDRDKAFVSYNGALLGLARVALPRLVKYGPKPHPAMFYNAVNFDRRLLVSLTRAEFDSAARFLQRVITDSVIDDAIRSMPKEYQALQSDLASRIRARRNVLVRSADGFYRGLFEIVDLHGTDAADKATITRQADGSIDIRLESDGITYLDRRFDARDTREIRLYLQGGADTASISGRARRSIPLWVVGGTGVNTLVDESVVGRRKSPTRLYDRGGVPDANVVARPGDVDVSRKADKKKADAEPDSTRSDAEKKDAKLQHDEEAKKRATQGGYDPDTAWNRLPAVKFQGWEVPPFRDRGSSLRPTMSIRTGRGLGFMPVLELTRRKFGFRQFPYASKVELQVGYSTALQGWEAELKTDNRIESSRMFRTTETGLSELIAGRFGGFGNDIELAEDRSTLQAKERQYEFTPGIGWALGLGTEITMGPIVKYTITDSLPGTIIAEQRPYGFSRFGQAGFVVKFVHESTRQLVFHGGTADELMRGDHARGLTLDVQGAIYPGIWDADYTFGTLAAVGTGFATLSLPLHPIVAMRLGGQQNYGKSPYFEAAFLGGRSSVRTLPRNAYAGDAMVFGSAELRIPIAEFPFILPLNTGIFGFADAGRVYVDGDSPGGWHSGMGGGFWLGVLKPSTSLSLTFTNQRDRRVMVGTGFVF